jgi:Leucine-rich repeat (LRR) protein
MAEKHNFWFVTCLLLFHITALAEDTSEAAPIARPKRVLHFPDYALGHLYTQDEYDERDLYRGSWWGNSGERNDLGPAQGDVTVPAGKQVIMILAGDVWADPNKLEGLKQLRPDDLYNLTISPGWAAPGAPPPTDKCIPHITHLTGLKELDLSQSHISENGLGQLSPMMSLERLFTPEGLTNRGLFEITKLDSLRALYIGSLGHNRVSEKGFSLLERMKNLKELGLADKRLNDNVLGSVGRIKTLEYLAMQAPFTDEGIKHLTALPNLRVLNMHELSVTDAGFASIGRIKSLEEVRAIWMDAITDQGIQHLAGLPRLRRLDVTSANLTDASARVLSQIQTLEVLSLPAKGITDEGVRCLAGLTNLRELWVGAGSNSPLTGQSLIAVSAMRNLEALTIGGKGFTDEGMKTIARLKKLKRLCISTAPNVTDAGLAAIGTLSNLETLNWTFETTVSMAGLNQLNGLKKLKRISFNQVRKGNATLDLSGMESLENITLSLSRNGRTNEYIDAFTKEDWACFAHLKKLETMQISGKGVGDASLAYLKDLPDLIYLNVFGPSAITDEGLKYLVGKNKLARLTINHGYFTDYALQILAQAEQLNSVELSSDRAFSKEAIMGFKSKKKNVTLVLKP